MKFLRKIKNEIFHFYVTNIMGIGEDLYWFLQKNVYKPLHIDKYFYLHKKEIAEGEFNEKDSAWYYMAYRLYFIMPYRTLKNYFKIKNVLNVINIILFIFCVLITSFFIFYLLYIFPYYDFK